MGMLIGTNGFIEKMQAVKMEEPFPIFPNLWLGISQILGQKMDQVVAGLAASFQSFTLN